MATALYNRYRPRTFAEVVGQGHVTDALAQALRSGRIHHAYLFSGPRGCGKTSSARILAASLNCVNGPTPEPCGVCEHCVAIRSGTSVDVVEIDAASHGLVEDTRDLRERAAFMPASGRYRVFVVDEAHMITTQGFNALLKIVEEPPDYVIFVFATTDPDKVLPTIRSRTFHYQFGLVPPRILEAHLTSVCTQEGVTVEPAVLPLVVRVAEGSVRDSLSVLDQLLAGADEGGLRYAVAAARLGLTDALLLDEVVDGLAHRDAASVFGVVQRVVEAGQDPRRFAMDLLDRLRDLLLIEAVPDAPDRGMLDACPPDQLDRMRSQGARLGVAELSRAADVTHAALIDMRGTTTPRLALELMCARILLPAAATDSSGVLVRLERLERRLQAGSGATEAAPPPAAAAEVALQSAAASAPAGLSPAQAARLAAQRGPVGGGERGPVGGGERGPVGGGGHGRPAGPAPARGTTTAGGEPPAGPAPAAGPAVPAVPADVPATGPDALRGAQAPDEPPHPADAGLPPPPEDDGWPEPASFTARDQSRPSPAAPAAGSAGSTGSSRDGQPLIATAAGAVDLNGLRGYWPQVLEAVKNMQGGRTAHALLTPHAEVLGVEGSTVTLGYANASIGRNFSTNGIHVEKLVDALASVLGGRWRVVVGGPGGGAAAGSGGRAAGDGASPVLQAPAGSRPTSGGSAPAEVPAAHPGTVDAGFAPGDEPVAEDESDDQDAASAVPRLHGDDLALGLLKEHMGATVVGELDNV